MSDDQKWDGAAEVKPEQQAEQDITKSKLFRVLMDREIRKANKGPKVVGYVDMLGFGALAIKHPEMFDVEIDEEALAVNTFTSKSHERFGRFHAVLDRLAANELDSSRPERMMIFSDCAFAVYDNALQAAVSLSAVMRQLLRWAVPVRMCIAKGSCHFQRFSIESFPRFNLTRSMFHGSGVVCAVVGEEESGAGCRIFLSTSLEDADRALIEKRLTVLPMEKPSKHAAHELNYLSEPDPTGATDPEKDDTRIYAGLTILRSELRAPIPARVLEQYDESFALFNRMRKRLGRTELLPPKFDGEGNYIDPREAYPEMQFRKA